MSPITDTVDDAELLTVPEVARLWRVSPEFVRQRCHRGDIDHIRLGRAIRITRADALAFIERSRRSAS